MPAPVGRDPAVDVKRPLTTLPNLFITQMFGAVIVRSSVPAATLIAIRAMATREKGVMRAIAGKLMVGALSLALVAPQIGMAQQVEENPSALAMVGDAIIALTTNVAIDKSIRGEAGFVRFEPEWFDVHHDATPDGSNVEQERQRLKA